ncbi:hypothetical protein [Glutamicibacter sp. HZAU]|uniref:hypothetical protein n=1 Tax=Glutamicibacter sp. HZAU TaxID=2049891 RepID=UPI000FFC4297|nr:hypothetical protein [Glutamicibacter sp. HZAU]RWZ82833.1 hypothetical protein EKH49_10190 [Glutamicibacter sp. HZAU]
MEFERLHHRITHNLAIGRETEAIALLKDQLNEHHQVPAFWILYSSCHLNLEQWAEAESNARAALNLDPANPVAGECLAIALMRQHRRDEALLAIRQVIEADPEYGNGHYWLSMITLSGIRSNDDRVLARQAIEHAIRLDPGNPAYYQGAAIVAEAQDDNRAALAFLQAGLQIDANHQGLLRVAGGIGNGEKIVGDQGDVLRGLISMDPMNEGLHQDYAESFVAKQSVYAHRFWLFAPVVAAAAALGQRAGGAGTVLAILAIAVLSGLFGWWNKRQYSEAAKFLPAGYTKDIAARYPKLPRAMRAYQLAWLLGAGGAMLGCFLPVAGIIVMLLGVLASQLGALWILQENAGPPAGTADRHEQRRYLIRCSGMHAEGFWKRVGLVLCQLVIFGICLANGSRIAAVPAGSIAAGLLFPGFSLLAAQFRLGFKENAFAFGLAATTSAKNRNLALLRGNIGGLYFIGVHLFIGLIAATASFTLLASGVDSSLDPASEDQTPRQENVIDENLLKRLEELETRDRQIREYATPTLPELPDIPSLSVPEQ